jgi:uncharacterized protein YndB with AHSA1/START domain
VNVAGSANAPKSEVTINVPKARVFDVLTDVESYPSWLVGAQRIRAVDDSWPQDGTSFHHTVGAGPLRVNDKTTIIDRVEPSELRLRAGIGPSIVRFDLHGSDGSTRVAFSEVPDSGLVRLGWKTFGRPLMRLGIWGRNTVSLEQLKDYLESGSSTRD